MNFCISGNEIWLGTKNKQQTDLYMNLNDVSKCYSNLGYGYELDHNQDHINSSLLAGQFGNWTINEIEVHQVFITNSHNQ